MSKVGHRQSNSRSSYKKLICSPRTESYLDRQLVRVDVILLPPTYYPHPSKISGLPSKHASNNTRLMRLLFHGVTDIPVAMPRGAVKDAKNAKTSSIAMHQF